MWKYSHIKHGPPKEISSACPLKYITSGTDAIPVRVRTASHIFCHLISYMTAGFFRRRNRKLWICLYNIPSTIAAIVNA